MQNEYFPLHGGGKPNDLKDVIQHGIRFNPASMIVKVLLAGTELLCRNGRAKSMSISAEEATYCIFDVVRYAGDILDHMTLADMLDRRFGYYSLKETRNR